MVLRTDEKKGAAVLAEKQEGEIRKSSRMSTAAGVSDGFVDLRYCFPRAGSNDAQSFKVDNYFYRFWMGGVNYFRVVVSWSRLVPAKAVVQGRFRQLDFHGERR